MKIVSQNCVFHGNRPLGVYTNTKTKQPSKLIIWRVVGFFIYSFGSVFFTPLKYWLFFILFELGTKV